MNPYIWKRHTLTLVFVCMLLVLGGGVARPGAESILPATSGAAVYIVQADTTAAAAAAVEQAGGTITHDLGIINGVAATLGPAALTRLHAVPGVVLHADTPVRTADDDDNDNDGDGQETDTAGYDLYPAAAVNVSTLHEYTVVSPEIRCHQHRIRYNYSWQQSPLMGGGVTVAVVDTGLLPMDSSDDWEASYYDRGTLVAENSGRCIIYRDFVGPSNDDNSIDENGHGTHVVGTIADNRETEMAADTNAMPVGIAPQANLVIARALGADGSGSYADVINALDWIVRNKNTYNIRVLNLSLYAPVTGYYWEDPLNQAVMRVWQAGIVVVTVAGNDGPDAGTITAPGNVPYVITVGALTSGRYTSSGMDELADYSARGPTESAFVKPDVLVPATRTIAALPEESYLGQQFNHQDRVSSEKMDLKIGSLESAQNYYQLSGTSMAAAEVSGIVALILQVNPYLTPDQVKYRLLATARPAIDEVTNEPLYTVWEQGAGLVEARQAIFDTSQEAANTGMDIALDLNPYSGEHYWGYTTWDESASEFRLIDTDSGEQLEAWGGGRRSSAGSTWLWTSGRRSSAGGRRSSAGGRRSSAGSTLLWAGSERPWLQQDGQIKNMSIDLVLEGDTAPIQADHTTWLPLVMR